MTGAIGTTSAEEAYWSYIGELVAPVIAAYVITQASGWVADLAQGRVEMALSGPVTWTMLVRAAWSPRPWGSRRSSRQWWRRWSSGLHRSADGSTRWASAGWWASACSSGWPSRPWQRSLSLWSAGPWLSRCWPSSSGRRTLVAFLVPMFGWPDWLNRMSVFWAFGHPYLRLPPASGLAVLIVLAVAGDRRRQPSPSGHPRCPKHQDSATEGRGGGFEAVHQAPRDAATIGDAVRHPDPSVPSLRSPPSAAPPDLGRPLPVPDHVLGHRCAPADDVVQLRGNRRAEDA